MRRILFIHVSAILGGSERSFLDLIEKTSSVNRRNFLIILPSFGPLEQELQKRAPEIKVIHIPFPHLFSKGTRKLPLWTLAITLLSLPVIIIYLSKLVKIIKQFSPDIIYSNGLKCHLLSLIIKKIKPVTTVWHMQDFFPDLRYLKYFFTFIRTQPNLIICNSNNVKNNLVEFIPTSWTSKILTVHNSVDIHQFIPRVPLSTGPIVISMVGMITPWKGQDIFIEAIKELYQFNPDFQFICQIIGDEAYQTYGEMGFKAQLIKRVESLGLSNKIKFLGLVKEVEKIYQTSDIVVHCSTKPEPFGRVIIEAMASECCMIATEGGGVNEIITDGVNGLLVEPSAPSSLRIALEKIYNNPQLRNSLSKAGRKTVEEKFSADVFSKTIFSQLEKHSLL